MDSAGQIFSVGKLFPCFADVEEARELYQKTKYVQLYKRDARTVVAARSRGIKRPLSDEIKYYELRYCCIHGGLEFK